MDTDINVYKTPIHKNKNNYEHDVKKSVSSFYIFLSNTEENISKEAPRSS